MADSKLMTDMHVAWTFPAVPSFNTMFMLEAMTFKIALTVETPIKLSDVVAEAWTNLYHKDNPEGAWHAIPLDLMIATAEHPDSQIPGQRMATFGNAIMLTSDGQYAFTFRFRDKRNMAGTDSENDTSSDAEWVWAGSYGNDGIVDVRPPNNDSWSTGPQYSHISGAVHLGNFMAASVADQLGFDAVLNVADTLDLITSKFCRPVEYKKIYMRDGAVNPIPQEQIREAVDWLRETCGRCEKVLVNCRAGIGRAGSVTVAYVFAEEVTLTYEQAYQFVFSKRFVYPHKGLRDTLYQLFPRKIDGGIA